MDKFKKWFTAWTEEEIQEYLNEIKEVRAGMSWGTEEHGIPQLTHREQFLLWYIENK